MSSGIPFQWIGVSKGYHQLSHATTSQSDQAAYVACQQWIAARVAKLISALDAIPYGVGSLLDHTLVVWLSETGDASYKHLSSDLPVVLIGNLGGKLKTGQVLAVDRPIVDLHYTVGHALGVNMSGFGAPSLSPQLISALLAP